MENQSDLITGRLAIEAMFSLNQPIGGIKRKNFLEFIGNIYIHIYINQIDFPLLFYIYIICSTIYFSFQVFDSLLW